MYVFLYVFGCLSVCLYICACICSCIEYVPYVLTRVYVRAHMHMYVCVHCVCECLWICVRAFILMYKTSDPLMLSLVWLIQLWSFCSSLDHRFIDFFVFPDAEHLRGHSERLLRFRTRVWCIAEWTARIRQRSDAISVLGRAGRGRSNACVVRNAVGVLKWG